MDAKTKLKIARARRGKLHTEAAKQRIRLAKQRSVIRFPDGLRFESVAAAAEALGVSQTSVSLVLRQRRSSIKGYTFKYEAQKDGDPAGSFIKAGLGGTQSVYETTKL